MFLLLLFGSVLWFALPRVAPLAEGARLSLLLLWLIGGVVGGLLAPRTSPVSQLSVWRALPLTPLYSLLISSALFLAVSQGAHLLLLVPLHLLWFGVEVTLQLLWFRYGPPLHVGVYRVPGRLLDPASPLLAPRATHPGIRYVPLTAETARHWRALPLVLEQPEYLTQPEYRQLLGHLQALRVPTLTQGLLEEELTGRASLHLLRESWLDQRAFSSRYERFKRVLDVLCTLLLLPVLLPLLLIVALVVLLNSGRPVLFWQERVGRGGVPFRLVKFRTMTRDSERSGPAFASRTDQRVTPVGNFLRKFRLDELPQFWNVLRGEMSVIGPRPEQWAFAADFEETIPLYATRHWVRPGITGWAQVHQGYTDNLTQTTEKLRYDFYYVKHLSLSLDLVVVARTILTILTGFGAR